MKNCLRRMGSMQTFTIRSSRMSLRNSLCGRYKFIVTTPESAKRFRCCFFSRENLVTFSRQAKKLSEQNDLMFVPDHACYPRLLERKEKIWYAVEK